MRILWEFSRQILPKSKIESKEERFQKKKIWKKNISLQKCANGKEF